MIMSYRIIFDHADTAGLISTIKIIATPKKSPENFELSHQYKFDSANA